MAQEKRRRLRQMEKDACRDCQPFAEQLSNGRRKQFY
jgi:hypothetical protein